MDLLLMDTSAGGAAAKPTARPKPVTTGFRFSESMFQYELDGTWDDKAFAAYAEEAGQSTEMQEQWAKMTVDQQRPMMDMYAGEVNENPANKAYRDKVCASAANQTNQQPIKPHTQCVRDYVVCARTRWLVFRFVAVC